MISQKAKYALRALVALTRTEAPLTVAEIAAEQKIPKKFLEQILLELKNNGLLAARRGRIGGYSLLRPADQITFGQILRIIDGPIAPLPCLSRMWYKRCEDCASEKTCEIRRVFSAVADSARLVLDQTTLAMAVAGGPGTGSAFDLARLLAPAPAESPANAPKPTE